VNATEIVEAVRLSFTPGPTPDGLAAARVGDDYKNTHANGAAGVRVSHAQAALRDPDAVETFIGEGSRHILVSKRVDVSKPFMILLELHSREDGLHLSGGWRIYGATDPATPLELFAGLVERFGLPVRFGGLTETNFMPLLTVPQFSGDASQLVEFPTNPGRSLSVSCMMRRSPEGDMHLEWGYAVDTGRYETDTARDRP
jgi:hypothetical protein